MFAQKSNWPLKKSFGIIGLPSALVLVLTHAVFTLTSANTFATFVKLFTLLWFSIISSKYAGNYERISSKCLIFFFHLMSLYLCYFAIIAVFSMVLFIDFDPREFAKSN